MFIGYFTETRFWKAQDRKNGMTNSTKRFAPKLCREHVGKEISSCFIGPTSLENT